MRCTNLGGKLDAAAVALGKDEGAGLRAALDGVVKVVDVRGRRNVNLVGGGEEPGERCGQPGAKGLRD